MTTAAKEHPIIFNAWSILHILNGTKTQTRRVIKKHPLIDCGMSDAFIKDPDNYVIQDCPFGGVGDLLWVRETYEIREVDTEFGVEERIFYRVDCDDKPETRWCPAIFMPRKYSRLFLEITDVRIERVQDIIEADALAEGCRIWMGQDGIKTDTAVNDFARIWEEINAKRGFSLKVNPWVWVISFRPLAADAKND